MAGTRKVHLTRTFRTNGACTSLLLGSDCVFVCVCMEAHVQCHFCVRVCVWVRVWVFFKHVFGRLVCFLMPTSVFDICLCAHIRIPSRRRACIPSPVRRGSSCRRAVRVGAMPPQPPAWISRVFKRPSSRMFLRRLLLCLIWRQHVLNARPLPRPTVHHHPPKSPSCATTTGVHKSSFAIAIPPHSIRVHHKFIHNDSTSCIYLPIHPPYAHAFTQQKNTYAPFLRIHIIDYIQV